MYTAIMTKTQEAQQMGDYQQTDIDAAKAAADFRIVDVSCRLKRIIWRDGRRQSVNSRNLQKLQAQYIWATDF